ncbi:flagellar FliJ family protein [Parendozoicomonas haliclonae]|uniref:Flagellar FliJ protein n=1 Tax=Parendozoicomonas haliclonae TaxID=1960125 RepID=A0A1X7AGH5_9GAMM|nr:flagellar FliJ family protein [Parendozoicomonas haliclonae]SMA39704.1 Flagellar FliJ protein [Parendozoicomonas haliclonae]
MSLNQSHNSTTDKSIHLLNKCLDHQRTRFDQARMRTHQAAMFLRNQTLQLEKLDAALEDYRNTPSYQKPLSLTNQIGFRQLLLDIRDLQSNEVEREQKTFQRCQDEALKEQQKIKSMEKAMEKLRRKQQLLANKQEQKQLDEQAANQFSRQQIM